MSVLSDIPAELNELAERVIGAAIEVHRELGAGFAEETYQKAMAIELEKRGLAFAAEHPVDLKYKAISIGRGKIDILIEGVIVIELKSAEPHPKRYRRQVINYLKATGLQLGYVINFNSDVLKDGIVRIVNTK